MKNNQTGFITPILITVIILLILGGGTYAYLKKNKKIEIDTKEGEITALSQKIDNDTDKPFIEDKNNKSSIYINKQWNFSFELPKEYKVHNKLNPGNDFGDSVVNYDSVEALYSVENSTFTSEQHEFAPYISIKIIKNLYVQNNVKKIFNSPEKYVDYLKSQDTIDHYDIYKNSKVTSYDIGTNKAVKFFADTGEMPGGGENIPLGTSHTIVFHDGYIYEFSYWINDIDLSKDFDKIMSTLKFVN